MKSMDGILIIDKPAGLTSHDVVARVRRILGTRRVGHTGTLDPFATGVMVVLVGKATRLAQFLDKDTKEYIADLQFGFETDTGDLTGSEKAEGKRQTAEGVRRQGELSNLLSSVDWNSVLERFRGETLQTPPMYSAKKIEGKKLYELARQGIEVERQPVHVIIHELELLPSEIGDPRSTIRIRVVCSAGTYIRTLAEDIGRVVGVGAHLSALRRTAAGKFDLQQSISLEHLESSTVDRLLPIDLAVSHLAEFQMDADRAEKTRNGLATRVDDDRFAAGQRVRMMESDGNTIAVGIYDDVEKIVRPKVVLI
ncbi:MAG: tRNA pseudouridine(55) synthase TruB [Acidobacteriota bacterium]